jgi:hypothetical protein
LAEGVVLAIGSVLVLFSPFCFELQGGASFSRGFRRPARMFASCPRALLVSINGFLGLIALAGIWIAHTLA